MDKLRLTSALGLLMAVMIMLVGAGKAHADITSRDQHMGEVESTYAAPGPLEVAYHRMVGYQCHYPRTMEGQYPIIVWANDAQRSAKTYTALCRHLATWGFVVMTPDSAISGSGKEILRAIDHLTVQSRSVSNRFYGKLDFGKIGLSGHGIGASAIINAATDPRITCVAPIAPAPAGADRIKAPMFLIVAAQQSTFSPEMVRHTIYSNAKVATVFGIISNATDADFIPDGGSARGYLTAWFRYLLLNDERAKKAFLDDCEICEHTQWQVEMKRRVDAPIPDSK